MKVILVARKALAAYLISSLVRRLVNRIGALVEEQRAIDLAHHLAAEVILGPDHDPVGPLEIADRRAFAQELGVGDDRDLVRRSGLVDNPLHLVPGADRHGRLGDDHGVVRQLLADFARDFVNEGEIGVAIAPAAGRADRDEDRRRTRDPLTQIGGEAQASGLHIAIDQRIKARFVDRHDPGVEPVDLALILVDADHLVPEIGEARP